MNADAKQPRALNIVSRLEPGIVCFDIDRMIEFYTAVLGLKLVADAETSPEMSAKFGATPHGYRIVRLQTPHGDKVKLVQPKKPLAIRNQVPAWVFERPGLAYITFVIANVKEVMARLREAGVKLVSQEPVEVRKGIIAIFAEDPEGNFFELVEYSREPWEGLAWVYEQPL